MISFSKALQTILREAQPLSSEKVKLRNAFGRTIADDIVARENLPPFDNSAMDGFAIRSVDARQATLRKPMKFKIVGESSAGIPFGKKVGLSECVRIMTGGVVPEGADAIVPVEMVKGESDDAIMVHAAPRLGAHIRRAGDDVALGTRVLARGERLTAGKIGVLASLGHAKVKVSRRPRVNILATGNELVAIDETPGCGQIRNSNSYVLAAFVEQTGAEAKLLGRVADKRKKLVKEIKRGLDADVLLITGGVSVGKYDLVKDVLSELGVKIRFWQVSIKPGKPLLFGTDGKTLVFGLPGNPVSASVTFLQFVRPAIAKMLGQSSSGSLTLTAFLDEPLKKRDDRRHFVRGVATDENGRLHVRTTGTQSSGALSSMAKANCLIVIPENTSSLRKGSKVLVELV